MTWWIAEVQKENEDYLIEQYQEDYDNFVTPRWRIERKRELVKKRLIVCAICPLHRGENGKGWNPHRTDKYKNHRMNVRSRT